MLRIENEEVLIETQWNVKEESDLMASAVANGINRNIVECKATRVAVPASSQVWY